MQVKIKKTVGNAITPTYGTDGAACFDLYSTQSAHVMIGGSEVFDTGIAFEVPEDHVMQVFSRSGHGFKSDVSLSNCVGIIDQDFRGTVKVKLRNDGNTPYYVAEGDRIAQAMIIKYPKVNFNEVEEISETDRGTGGLGSTGK
jgi:dUTP pyrophosphatase